MVGILLGLCLVLLVVVAYLANALKQKPTEVVIFEEVEVPAKEIPTEVEVRDWLPADIEARERVLDSMQRNAMAYAVEASTTAFHLDAPDQKGRIIGREGRNLKSFEQTTGVELIIDDAENSLTISSFDPYRREVARLTLELLLKDGKIQPTKIEECFQLARSTSERDIRQFGGVAAKRVGVKLPDPVLQALGKLKFRTSFAQNVLEHSIETANLAGQIADDLGYNTQIAKRAGLLHDIGKALPEEGPHALTGMKFLERHNENSIIRNAVGAHHLEIQPESPEARIVIIADTLSASRPGARRENHDNYLTRLLKIEEIAKSYKGVERCFAIQAGRELRIIVKPEELDDQATQNLLNEVGQRIAQESDHSGQVTITTIRESRFTGTFRF